MTESKNNLPEGTFPHIGAAASIADRKQLLSELSSLREEVRNSEEARLDFLKYKLIAVATLASIALGFEAGGSAHPSLEPLYILSVIPFVCVYADALCYHNSLRILVIAKYLKSYGDSYEGFLDKWDLKMKEREYKKGIRYFFGLEDWALDISTWALCGLVIIAGICSFVGKVGDCLVVSRASTIEGILIAASGFLGLILSWEIKREHKERADIIDEDSCDQIKTFVRK